MDYKNFVTQFERTYLDAAGKLVDGHAQIKIEKLKNAITGHQKGPIALIVAPHPDDECLMGSYAYRLMTESGATVHVMPYSYGSKVERQTERKIELERAVRALRFNLVNGVASNADDLLKALLTLKPDFLFSPHENDGHETHMKTFRACRDALIAYLGKEKTAAVKWLQTEFWQSLEQPNLLVSLSAETVTKIGSALLEHKGEIARNPYHLRLPAWYMDQVRRGSERVLGSGTQGVESVFGQLFTQLECQGNDPAQWILAKPEVV